MHFKFESDSSINSFLPQLFVTECLAADMWLIILLQSFEELMIFGPMNDPSATWVIHGKTTQYHNSGRISLPTMQRS
jgi:hypothetical protein